MKAFTHSCVNSNIFNFFNLLWVTCICGRTVLKTSVIISRGTDVKVMLQSECGVLMSCNTVKWLNLNGYWCHSSSCLQPTPPTPQKKQSLLGCNKSSSIHQLLPCRMEGRCSRVVTNTHMRTHSFTQGRVVVFQPIEWRVNPCLNP